MVPGLLILTTLCLQGNAVSVPLLGAGWARPDPNVLPVGLLPHLRAYEQGHAKGTPVFNDLFYGGFLIYYTPGLRVFIDDRCELYGDDGLLEYAHAYFDDPAQIDRWQSQYHFDLALVAGSSGFDRYLSRAANWTVVAADGPAVLYRRAGR